MVRKRQPLDTDQGERVLALAILIGQVERMLDESGDPDCPGGGRWNHPGTPLLYASSSRALACLETLVHLQAGSLPLNRYLVVFEVPAAGWRAREVFQPAGHVGWDAEPPGQVSMDWGAEWAQQKRTIMAEVPSVVVPEETNILINPLAPDANRIGIRQVRRWLYDLRPRATGRGMG